MSGAWRRLRGPVWVDLANSPHVLFFQPILAELTRRGVGTVVTARDFAQTADLCALMHVEAQMIGVHGGGHIVAKGLTMLSRVRHLRSYAQAARPVVAVSHNSYAQAVAARSLGLPVVTAMDYEFQPANHLAFRCASLVIVPDAYPLDALRHQGARPTRTWRYPGLKEEIEFLGPVKMRDVEAAQTDIVSKVRALEETGEIVLSAGTDDVIL